MTVDHAQYGTIVPALRRPRKWKVAVHWIDRSGEVACGTPLTADQIADGKLLREVGRVTCSVCCKQIELSQQKDFFGRPKVSDPQSVDWWPLFEKRVSP